jgi:hypothetical protein
MPRVPLLLLIAFLLTVAPGKGIAAAQLGEPELVELADGRQAVHGEFYALAPGGLAGTRPAATRIVDKRPGDPFLVAAELTSELGVPIYPNVIGYLAQTTEPGYSSQWPLDNDGQTGGVVDADIDAEEAWMVTTGDPETVVAVIDSGVDASHPDLATQLWTNADEIGSNGIDDDGNGYIDDTYGWDFVGFGDPVPDDDVDHGTAVAGIIAASVNGVGITGIAPSARIMPLRSCYAFAGESYCDSFDVLRAVEYAVDNGADVINLSLGFLGGIEPGVEQALTRARDAGILVVAAAGNFGDGTILYPASSTLDNVISVASTDHNDNLSTFSSWSGSVVDLGAPGEMIWSSAIVLPGFIDYSWFDGTSFAAPHVAGVAALMVSVNPGLSPAQTADLIMTYGDSKPSLIGTTSSGRRLNAGQAVFAARLLDIHTSTFRDDIVWLAKEGVTKGCNPPANNKFCPDQPVTRGEMAAFLTRALGLTTGAGSDQFSDDNGSIFEADIERLAVAGITKGCNPPDNDLFCPEDFVTREQMAAFLVRAFGYSDASGFEFVDVDPSSIFLGDISRLAAAGVTRGCNPPANTQFCPRDFVTRGQMAAFLRRALG